MTFGTMPDGSPLLVTGAAAGDTAVRVWDPTTRTKVSLDAAPEPEVHAVCFGTRADGTTLLATGEGSYGGEDGYVRLRDPMQGRIRSTIPCHARCVLALDFTTSADGTLLLGAGGYDGKVTLIGRRHGREACYVLGPSR